MRSLAGEVIMLLGWHLLRHSQVTVTLETETRRKVKGICVIKYDQKENDEEEDKNSIDDDDDDDDDVDDEDDDDDDDDEDDDDDGDDVDKE